MVQANTEMSRDRMWISVLFQAYWMSGWWQKDWLQIPHCQHNPACWDGWQTSKPGGHSRFQTGKTGVEGTRNHWPTSGLLSLPLQHVKYDLVVFRWLHFLSSQTTILNTELMWIHIKPSFIISRLLSSLCPLYLLFENRIICQPTNTVSTLYPVIDLHPLQPWCETTSALESQNSSRRRKAFGQQLSWQPKSPATAVLVSVPVFPLNLTAFLYLMPGQDTYLVRISLFFLSFFF